MNGARMAMDRDVDMDMDMKHISAYQGEDRGLGYELPGFVWSDLA